MLYGYIYTYITHIFRKKCSQSFYEQSHTFQTNFVYTIRTSMRFPLCWYVDGLCTIKIVEMADKSLYALKLRNNAHLLSFYKFGTKKATYEIKNEISRLSVVRLWRESCCKSQIAVANRTTRLKVIWKKLMKWEIGKVRISNQECSKCSYILSFLVC